MQKLIIITIIIFIIGIGHMFYNTKLKYSNISNLKNVSSQTKQALVDYEYFLRDFDSNINKKIAYDVLSENKNKETYQNLETLERKGKFIYNNLTSQLNQYKDISTRAKIKSYLNDLSQHINEIQSKKRFFIKYSN